MRLWTSAEVAGEVNTVSNEPPPCRLSSPRPEVKALKDAPSPARRALVVAESDERLEVSSWPYLDSQRVSIFEPRLLKKASTSAGDAPPRSAARRRAPSRG